MAGDDIPVNHPSFSWRYKSRPNKCDALIARDAQGQPRVHFQGETRLDGYFHPDDIDGIIAALKAAKDKIG